jgi:hypothetical protein
VSINNIKFEEGYSSLGKALETERAKYGDHPHQRYSATHSPIDVYRNWFFSVLKGHTIVDLVINEEKPVVIDLMSATGALSTLFEKLPQRDKLGIAVSLGDSRTDEDIAEDNSLGIEQVVGDIVSSSTWRDIKESLQGRKADLIMERSLGGIRTLPCSKLVYLTLLQRAWDILADEGTMLLQPPFDKKTHEPLPLTELMAHLRSLGIDARSDEKMEFDDAILIRKRKGDPAKLFQE